MALTSNPAGSSYRVTATGTIAIVNAATATGANPGNFELLGILAHATAGATCVSVQVFATATATATANALSGVIVFQTGSASYIRVPAYSPSGLGVIVGGGTNPDLTLFYRAAP